MNKNYLVATIGNQSIHSVVGRIGGNIPEYFLDKSEQIDGYKFYLSIEHPAQKGMYLTILVPQQYDIMLEKNIYPHCAIKVIPHTSSIESKNCNYTLEQINKMNLVGYKTALEGEFITVTSQFNLLQDEIYYFENLVDAGYKPFLQIDEDYYPEELLTGSYIFGYGALYLYQHEETKEVIAGFWQYS
ncbi:TPA: hypothetical protein SMT94_001670 [Proteus mirabilis]